ncbi:hypothetical protein RND81_10G150300 [Saponaria officinalis]|uniref:PGG domain-containing protein n=1 Tax=Saponaria officinalis TaxID=3572 RepID=A0AAW1I2G9_SAPOF
MQVSDDIESGERYEATKSLYKALYGESESDARHVLEECGKLSNGALHVFTLHNNTPLHKTCYIKNYDLANKLLDQLPPDFPISRLMFQNSCGNSLLHDSSTSNKGVEFITKLLTKAPGMLHQKNRWGETAAFQAVRYGRRHVFLYLVDKIDKLCACPQNGFDHLYFFQRHDKTTILHMAILTGYYDIGLIIAKRYRELCNLRAQDGLTALQILASSPTAFFSGNELGILKGLIYSCISVDDDRDVHATETKGISSIFNTEGEPWCTWSAIDNIRTQKRSQEDALELVKILVSLDTSWQKTYRKKPEVTPSINRVCTNYVNKAAEAHDIMVNETTEDENGSISYDNENGDTPLIIAATAGCIEIVEEILEQCPQAMEHLNRVGQNVLHVSLKNRNLNVFRLVLKKNLDIRGSLRVIDYHGNCILHMVGLKKLNFAAVKLKSPLLQLSDNLRLFEDVQMMCPSYLVNHRNNQKMTPFELMELNNEELRSNAKDWLRQTAEYCTAVIILIVTVTFAAAYTVPGGSDQNTGFPILIRKPFFIAFTMTDVLTLSFALTALAVFLSLLTSSYKLRSFCRSLPQKVLFGFTLLFCSVTMMMISFASTVILIFSGRKQWTKVFIYIAAFVPVFIFVVSYIPLYVKLARTLKYWFITKCLGILPLPACITAMPKDAYGFRRGGI